MNDSYESEECFMKKALVIGGSSGIGLAIAKNLIEKGYHVDILSRREPEKGILAEGKFDHRYCDMLDLDEDLLSAFAEDPALSLLMITAGIGRVADFEYFHTAEIDHIMTVNATSTIRALRLFYDRIKGKDSFYCGVMGSISGLMSSPMAAVYAASKAAVCRFVESVNIELEVAQTDNRILNVSPASFKGSRFNGGENRLDLLEGLAEKIIGHIFSRDTLYIPQYEETFRAVLERYRNDPHEYGLYSYQYKKSSDRVMNERKVVIGYLSGTFDLFHIGHLNLIKRAKKQCDYLIVGVHDSGAWKGKETFVPFEERKEIIAACRYVDKVVDAPEEDSDAWELYHYDRLFVGSDYQGSKRFQAYECFFEDKGVKIIYFPYTKTTSSTQIRDAIMKRKTDSPDNKKIF